MFRNIFGRAFSESKLYIFIYFEDFKHRDLEIPILQAKSSSVVFFSSQTDLDRPRPCKKRIFFPDSGNFIFTGKNVFLKIHVPEDFWEGIADSHC